MIYPANFEQKVGFDRLREQVAALCTIRGGRERLCAEQFSTSQADVERRLALADEMDRDGKLQRARQKDGEHWFIDGLDVRAYARRIREALGVVA